MNPADPIAFDYEQLAAQLVAHRLSQPDVTALLDPGSPERRRAAMAELTAVFQRNAAVFAASRAIENRAPLSEILSALTAAKRSDIFFRCRAAVFPADASTEQGRSRSGGGSNHGREP